VRSFTPVFHMIRFPCTCGKSLKAPDKLAGNQSRCPACRATIVVPRLALVLSGGEQSEAEESSPDNSAVYALASEPPSEFVPRVPLVADFSFIHSPLCERSSFDTLDDPLVGVKFILSLSGMLTLLTALGLWLYPFALNGGMSWLSGLLLIAVWAGAMSVLFGYGCHYLDLVLEHALRGDGQNTLMPDYYSGPAMTSFVKWALCFVSGPAFPIFFAVHYWIHSGDMTAVDGLILAELSVPAITYWMIGLVVLSRRPEIANPSPRLVLKAIRRLGLRALLGGIGVTAAGFVHIFLGVTALVLLHGPWPLGLALLWLCWFSAWQCGAFALRTLGLWYYRSRTVGGKRPGCPAAEHDDRSASQAGRFVPESLEGGPTRYANAN
jgi:hypothetical protein